MIPFAVFEPDRSVYAADASINVTNCLPVRDGWGPLPDLEAISEALGEPCRGAVYVRTSTGAYRQFAGTETALYEFNASDYSWDDVSGSSAPYAVPSGDQWSFNAFGTVLIAANLTDEQQFINIDSGLTFADLTGAPKARYIFTAGEYHVSAHLAGFPNRVQTSGIGDASFHTIGERGCDFQDFPDGEEIMGGIGAERGAIILQRTMIRQMSVVQVGNYSFTTSVLNPSRGVAAPLSIAQVGPGRFFYYSPDGFFLGAEGQPIGAQRVDRWFQGMVDPSKITEIRAVADPFNKIVWVQAEDPAGTKFLVGYNWQLDRWCFADNNVSQMCVMVTPGTTWDGMDDLYTSIDEADIPFDSALLSGGALRFAAFSTDNRLGFFTGSPRAATIDTAEIKLSSGTRTLVQEARPVTDADEFTLRVATSDKPGGASTFGSTITPFAATGICHLRADGLFHKFRLQIPEGESWNHAIGLDDVRSKAAGRR